MNNSSETQRGQANGSKGKGRSQHGKGGTGRPCLSVPVGFSFATTVPTNPKTSFPAELPGRSWESRGRIASTCYLWLELIIFELVEQDTPRRSLQYRGDLLAPEEQTGDGDNGGGREGVRKKGKICLSRRDRDKGLPLGQSGNRLGP